MKSRPVTRAVIAMRRGFRNWRSQQQLLPSVLFDLNRYLSEDLGLVQQDVIDIFEKPRKRR